MISKHLKQDLQSNLSDRDAKQLFDAVKKGMGLKERYESFTDFLNNDLREEYYQEKYSMLVIWLNMLMALQAQSLDEEQTMFHMSLMV